MFVRSRISFRRLVVIVCKYVLLSIVSALLFYCLFALLFDTRREKALRAENRYLSGEYYRMRNRMKLIDNTIEQLQGRDSKIYYEIFNTTPPDFSGKDSDTVRLGIDELETLSEEDLIWNAYVRDLQIESRSAKITAALASLDTLLRSGKKIDIPSIVPLRDFSVMSTGASVGLKINPFYKTVRQHNGIDLVAAEGSDVIAPADGTVISVSHSVKGDGNKVVISHGSGIQTVYSHLAKTKVVRGERVRRGDVIGTVGTSGASLAAHLHYEVWKDGRADNPVDYFFAQLDSREYREVYVISSTTGQSMD